MTPPAPPDRTQRWRERKDSFRQRGEAFDPGQYGVELIDADRVAGDFIRRHHYSGSMVAARLRVGLYQRRTFFAPELVGVAVFSVPMTQTVIPAYAPGLAPSQGVELGRLVLLDEVPANAESWFVSRAFRALRGTLPDVRMVLSFSDPLRRVAADGRVVLPGHVGIVYQALNARYVGRSAARWMHLGSDGRVVSPRAVSKIRNEEKGADYAYRQLVGMGAPPRLPFEEPDAYVRRALDSFRRVRHPGNHAYVWSLGGPLAFADALPYPKLAEAA